MNPSCLLVTSQKARPKVWLFDLDNTLHDASRHIFPRINRAMTDFIMRELAVDETEANHLRMTYWARYGATLTGLIRHHDIDPHHFLNDTHHFPDLATLLIAEPTTRHILRRLPGRKILFSNGPDRYANAVIRRMRIAHLFDAVFAIEHLKLRPKPQTQAYLRLLSKTKARPEDCILVEDSAANLKRAKALGMTTVWISASTRQPAYVDIRIQSLRDLPTRFAKISQV